MNLSSDILNQIIIFLLFTLIVMGYMLGQCKKENFQIIKKINEMTLTPIPK